MNKQVEIERFAADILPSLRAKMEGRMPKKWGFREFRMRREYGVGTESKAEVREALELEWKTFREKRARLKKLLKDCAKAPTPISDDLIYDLDLQYDTAGHERDGFLFYAYGDVIYSVRGPYSEAECRLLIREEAERERKYFEKITQQYADTRPPKAIANRERIPEKVRTAVWRRDQGRCARCGGRQRLEHDHIVPVAEGGSNTERNVELLCESCNRRKGKKIS